jgi:hypothetical protein
VNNLIYHKENRRNMNYLIRENILIIFIGFFAIFYTSCIQRNATSTFFILCIIVCICYFYINKSNKQDNTINNVKSYINNLSLKLIDLEIDNSKIYKIHKPPKTLDFILKNEILKNTLYDLRSMLIYDKASYLLLVVYLEYFMKFHYNVMIDKYDHKEYLSIMKDIRKEILNISKSFIFNAPSISLINLNIDLKDTLDKSHNLLQSFTYRYLMIMKHKFDKLGEENIPSTNEIDIHMIY